MPGGRNSRLATDAELTADVLWRPCLGRWCSLNVFGSINSRLAGDESA